MKTKRRKRKKWSYYARRKLAKSVKAVWTDERRKAHGQMVREMWARKRAKKYGNGEHTMTAEHFPEPANQTHFVIVNGKKFISSESVIAIIQSI